MLTAEQRAARADKITGSFAPWLMANDEEKILSKWRELIGDPAWRAEDFSGNWAMLLGSHVESLALDQAVGTEVLRLLKPLGVEAALNAVAARSLGE